ncbi:MAG: TonB-dependent receptor plug domain-containing protein [Chloroflexia bacterium]|nr:TonB-dependent receptor plug domain-containing protein [Chloroflexia bacterium]
MRKLSILLTFLLTMGVFMGQAQISISGLVSDDKGDPVPGANVRVKGYSDIGTITDLNGHYSLSVPDEAVALVFSFVGMTAKEVEIAGQTVMDITLSSEDVGIEEVVVTALGIKRNEKAIGYAATTLDSKAIEESMTEDVMSAIKGKVAGVQISNSGGPGASNSIIIRGITSLGGSNQPLFVIDGVPITNNNSSSGTAK